MSQVQPSPAGAHKAADADLLGEAVSLPTPGPREAGEGQVQTIAAPDVSLLPEPPPAEDENQPGFIGERNRPAP